MALDVQETAAAAMAAGLASNSISAFCVCERFCKCWLDLNMC